MLVSAHIFVFCEFHSHAGLFSDDTTKTSYTTESAHLKVRHTCCRSEDGHILYSFGLNTYKQLGLSVEDGSLDAASVFQPFSSNFYCLLIFFATEVNYSCAVCEFSTGRTSQLYETEQDLVYS